MARELRCDEYPMLDVDEAMSLVIREVQPLSTETVPLMQSIGRSVAITRNFVQKFIKFFQK
jgi:hypothetical protein